MGRLTLNVLLSFAQFEREVIGERVRDKISASKKKGIWVGGPVPLGYASINKKIVVIPEEAESVRTIFRRYLDLGSVGELVEDLDRLGIKTVITSYSIHYTKLYEPVSSAEELLRLAFLEMAFSLSFS